MRGGEAVRDWACLWWFVLWLDPVEEEEEEEDQLHQPPTGSAGTGPNESPRGSRLH